MVNSVVGAEPLALIQTLGDLSPGQISAIRRIPGHESATIPAIEARRPAAIFLDSDRFAAEQQRIFRTEPVPVTLSALIPEANMSIAHDGYGVPLLLTRDRAGKARAFLNACQHKGARVLEGCEPVKGGRLVCPYHAWTYATDGTLVGVARPETFVGLDRNTRPLRELPCCEAGGVLWVVLDPEAGSTPRIEPSLAADLDALDLGRSHVYARKTFTVQANWKLVLEPFLEGYHVQRLHANTVGKLFADVPNVVDCLGPHIRQISGKIGFTPADLDLPGENIHKTVTHAYQLFPNGVVVTSPWYISVMFIMPQSVDRTLVDYAMLTRAVPDNAKAEELYRRSWEMIINVFGNEDFRAAALCHSGLASGALDDVVYGGLEESILIYYRILESRLGLNS